MTIARPAVLLVLAGLVLSACTSTPPAVTPLSGVPSASIEVPLAGVGCTTGDTCVALGTSNAVSGPTTIGEDRRAHGTWHALNMPNTPSSRLDALVCAATSCLAGGAQPSGDLLWRYDATTRAVASLNAPAGGEDVRALACTSDSSCALVDSTSVVGAARLSFTNDAGATWSAPRTIAWTLNTTVTSLACQNQSTCLVAATTGTHVKLESTIDAGITWTPLAVSSTWRALKDVHCWASRCAALAVGDTTALVRSRNFAATWTSLALSSGARSVACASLTRCLVAGESTSGAGTITTIFERRLHRAALVYAPTPLFAAACGVNVCVAIGASTLVAAKP